MNRSLFRSFRGRKIPAADTRNEAGGVAYALTAEEALAQYAATGCLNGTFYAGAGEQLDTVLQLCARVEPAYIAKTAVTCREHGFMKDMPALLCAVLATRDGALLERIFDRVIDNGRMLRTFVQILRSGLTGRKSLGTRPRRLVRRWLADRSDDAVFRASVGSAPSLADVVRMVHPKPATASREALYGHLLGNEVPFERLPALVRAFEDFKAGFSDEVPDVPFQMLTGVPLDTHAWRQIATQGSWQMTRMNLNTFLRHGVFDDPAMVRLVADRLADPEAIRKARAFPYQLLVAFLSADDALPLPIREALQDALEIATGNVPMIDASIHVLVDVSGSMHSPVTGYRRGCSTAVRCVDVAALVAATLLRRQPDTEIIAFHDRVENVTLNPRDSIMTNAHRLASLPSGGTNCSAPLRRMNKRGVRSDLVIYVSDNQSWMDTPFSAHDGTETRRQWEIFRVANPQARLVCIDLQPYATTQAASSADILNVGGFSDAVFTTLHAFAAGEGPASWVARIETALN